jgi:hypothetical protein
MTMTDNNIRPAAAARPQRTEDQEWRYAEKAMTWSGWGSPVGAGIFFIAAGAAALLIRFAAIGF